MDPLVIVLTVVAAVLSIILVVVGVQTILVLQEVRRSLQRFNTLTDALEQTLNQVGVPLQNLGGMIQGMKVGLKMFESFAHFIKKQSDDVEK